MRNFTKVLVIGLAVIALSACSHKKSGLGGGDLTGNQDAETYGVGGAGSHFEGGPDSASTNAPEDQTYYFGYDDNRVSDNDQAAINAQAAYLVQHPQAKVRLEGHTDERGSREYNVGLGWRRDQGVGALLKQQGVAASQINMVSYGKEKPADAGHDESAWHLNRRVNLVYETK